jgi:tetratricopeptide (TPR) repeat protein
LDVLLVWQARERKSRGDERLRSGRAAEALPLYEEAVSLFRVGGDRHGEADCLQKLGRAALEARLRDRAQAALEEALALHRALGDERGAAADLAHLAQVRHLAQRYHEALDLVEEAIATFRRIGDRFGEALALRFEGNLFRDCYGAEPAIACYHLALALLREIGDPAASSLEALLHNVRMRLSEEEWAALERDLFPDAESARLEGARLLREADLVEGEGPTWA